MSEAAPSSLLLLPLLLICCLLPMLLRGMGQRPVGGEETDIWATPQKIREVFDSIGREIKVWREEAKAEAEGKPEQASPPSGGS